MMLEQRKDSETGDSQEPGLSSLERAEVGRETTPPAGGIKIIVEERRGERETPPAALDLIIGEKTPGEITALQISSGKSNELSLRTLVEHFDGIGTTDSSTANIFRRVQQEERVKK